MGFIKKIEFGNYTLTFGDKKVLLDLFDEVVFQSFLEMKYIRKLKQKGEYFFLDTQLIKLGISGQPSTVAIAGRIVKNTKLTRDQIFRRGGGLIEDKRELETAPSSIFVLLLDNHRLLFCREVAGAPTIQNFQSTSQYCLKRRHREFIEERFEEASSLSDFLHPKQPAPELQIQIGTISSNEFPEFHLLAFHSPRLMQIRHHSSLHLPRQHKHPLQIPRHRHQFQFAFDVFQSPQ